MTNEQAKSYMTKLLTAMSRAGGSDLFISNEFPPSMKTHGTMRPMTSQKLSGDFTRQLADSLMNERQRDEFAKELECNFAISIPGVARFRVNVFVQQQHVGMVIRTIPAEIPDFATLAKGFRCGARRVEEKSDLDDALIEMLESKGPYVLEVMVAGEPDPVTGMVLDLKELKEILEREVMQRMDHRFLNYEVAELKGQIPTCENIARVIWELLEPKITQGQLHRVRLYESADLFADCYRNGAVS